MAPPHYEIRVSGVLPPEALLDFEYLSASVEPVETVLYGELADLAALQGLLARLETFGVNVLEVRRLRTRFLGLAPDNAAPKPRNGPERVQGRHLPRRDRPLAGRGGGCADYRGEDRFTGVRRVRRSSGGWR